MASRNEGVVSPKDNVAVLQDPTWREGSQGMTKSSSSSSFQGINDPEALRILKETLATLQKGGTAEYLADRAKRKEQLASAQGLQSQYSTEKAFADAGDLMAQQLRLAMEKNMPAIQKSIEGAGTSASSMQGLLSQKLAVEGAQAAGALGAEQAKAYANAQVGLQGVLEALTRTDNTQMENLLKALDLTRIQTQSQSETASSWGSESGGGGGTYLKQISPTGGMMETLPTSTKKQAGTEDANPSYMKITPKDSGQSGLTQNFLDLALGQKSPDYTSFFQ